MAITMVRKPSETPNISNTDDFIGLRYAYGNQDGYVIGKGKELESQDDGSKFIIQSGRIVLQGVECDIDANGVLVPVDNISTKSYYTVYLEVNLAINESKIVARFDTVDYPKIDKGDDLTKNISGTARLELYHFIAENGIISEIEKIVRSVEYVNSGCIKNVKVKNAEYADDSNKINGIVLGYGPNRRMKIKNNNFTIPMNKTLFKETKTLKIGESISFSTSIIIDDILEIEFGVIHPNIRKIERIRVYDSNLKNSEDIRISGTFIGRDAPFVWEADLTFTQNSVTLKNCMLQEIGKKREELFLYIYRIKKVMD